MYFSPFAKKNKQKFDQDFKACWSFCFELKVLNESKFSMPWPLCLWQYIKTNSLTKIFETGIETLYEKKSFKSITCISDISIAHTFYLSQTPQTCLCKKKLPGVNFYRFNAKNWHFRQILREKVAFFYRFNAKNWQFTVYFAIITQKNGNLLCILS